MHETPEYIAEAVQRVRARLNLPHTRDSTLSTITAVPSASETLASLDRAALLARFWTQRPRRLACTECGDVVTLRGPLKGDAEDFRCMACINRDGARRYGRRVRAEARMRREGARDVA